MRIIETINKTYATRENCLKAVEERIAAFEAWGIKTERLDIIVATNEANRFFAVAVTGHSTNASNTETWELFHACLHNGKGVFGCLY